MIKLNHVFKQYIASSGCITNALDNIHITLPDRGMFFITGESGSGKTTLLNLIGGLDKADSGEIIINGRNFKDFSNNDFDDYRSQDVGFVFQDCNLLDQFSVRDNVAMPLWIRKEKYVDDDKIDKVLDLVSLSGYGSRMPNELSGGQKQRVAIARVLVKEPTILLADEPTGSLDEKNKTQVFELLKRISENCLVIVASHDKEAPSKYGDGIIVLEDGRVTSSQLPEPFKEAHKHRSPAKHGLKLKNAFSFSLSFLKNHLIRYIFTVIIGTISLGMYSTADTAFSYSREEALASSILQENYTSSIQLQKFFVNNTISEDQYDKLNPMEKIEYNAKTNVSMSIGDINKINEKAGVDFFGVMNPQNKFGTYLQFQTTPIIDTNDFSNFDYILYGLKPSGLIPVDSDENHTKLLCGHYPKNKDEVCITDLTLKKLELFGLYDFANTLNYFPGNIDSENVLDKKIGYSSTSGSVYSFTICGIIDSGIDYSSYEDLQMSSQEDLDNDEDLELLYNDFVSKTKNPMNNSLFISQEYYADYCNREGEYSYGSSIYLCESGNLDSGFLLPNFVDVIKQSDGNFYFDSNQTDLKDNEIIIKAENYFAQMTRYVPNEIVASYKQINYPIDSEDLQMISSLYESIDQDCPSNFSIGITDGKNDINKEIMKLSSAMTSTKLIDDCMTNHRSDFIGDHADRMALASSYDQNDLVAKGKLTFLLAEDLRINHLGNNRIQLNKDKNPYYSYYLSESQNDYLRLHEKYFDQIRNAQTEKIKAFAKNNDPGLAYSICQMNHDHISTGSIYEKLVDEGIKIVGISFDDSNGITISRELSKALISDDMISFTSAVYSGELSRAQSTRISQIHCEYPLSSYPEDGNYYLLVNNTKFAAIDMFDYPAHIVGSVSYYIALFLAVFTIIIIFHFTSITVHDKQHEIGILRSLGAKSKDVYKIFLLHSLLTNGIMFALSFIFPLTLQFIVNQLISVKYHSSLFLLHITIRQVVLTALIGIVVSLLGSFIPSIIISAKKPVDALRRQ